MKRLLIACLLLAAPAGAQTIAPSPQGLTTQFSSACTSTSCATWVLPSGPTTVAAVTISVTGTFTGTLTFEGSVDAITYVTISVTNLTDGSSATTTTTTGQFSVANSGFQALRVKATALSAGGPNLWAVRGGGVPKGLSPFLTRLYTGDGTCPLPAWSFASDTDLGVYRVGANNLAFCAGSVNLLDLNGTRLLASVPILAPDGSFTAPSYSWSTDSDTGWYLQGLGVVRLALNGAAAYEFAATTWSFLDDTATIRLGASSDVRLTRDASDVLALRRTTAGQTFRLYKTFTDASNYERLDITGAAGSDFRILTTSAGSGVAMPLIIGTVGSQTISLTTNNTGRWTVGTAGHLTGGSDNIYDIGASGATRPRTGFFGTSVVTPILQGSGTGVSVANVGANSCGSTAATIAGNQVSGVITVGTVAGTQCRVTFATAAPVARDCAVTDSTTTIASRATAVSTTTHDFFGAFVAGDAVTYVCTVR